MRELGRRYGWKPSDISEMTWPMIMMYLEEDTEERKIGGKPIVRFSGPDAMAKYSQWRRANFGAA